MSSNHTHAFYNSPEWKRLRLEVLHEGNHTCHWCGGKATQADHLIERDANPELALERTNIVPACRPCNSRRGSAYLAKKQALKRNRFLSTNTPTEKAS